MKSSTEDSHNEWLAARRRKDPWIAAITPERVGKALDGFVLPFSDGWNLERLTNAIQSLPHYERDGPSQSRKAAIAELRALASKARRLRQSFEKIGATADIAAFDEFDLAFRNDPTVDYGDLIIPSLDRFEKVMDQAISRLKSEGKQAPKWQMKAASEGRAAFAVLLMGLFEIAFGIPAKSNNWAAEYGLDHPWPDFFERIYRELFPKTRGLNRSELLQEAARQFHAWKDRDSFISWTLFGQKIRPE